jgi:elongation factor Ts
MAEITAQLVKQLRERTGAGMMECKSALVEAKGDLAEGEVVLRKRGIASAGKKASRATKQGLIGSYIHHGGQLGVMVEVNCESDFVARTDDFKELVHDLAMHIAAADPRYIRKEDVEAAAIEKETEIARARALAEGKPEKVLDRIIEGRLAKFYEEVCLMEQPFVKENTLSIGQLIKTKIAKLGENINISRFDFYEAAGNGVVGHYIHTGAQIGVLLEVTPGTSATPGRDEFKTLVRDIAMQVAAAHPQFVGREQVPAALIAKEREIQRERALGEGKPEKMVDKIAEGRMSKFYEEVCLLDQPFIRENTISVAELIKTVAAKIGDTISVVRFVRYKVGDAGDAPGVRESPLPVTA